MAISTPPLHSLSPPCRKYGYICKCNYTIVPWFSALLDSSRLFSTSPLLSLKCPCLLLATSLLVRPVCLPDYRALVAQVTRVTNLGWGWITHNCPGTMIDFSPRKEKTTSPTPSKRPPPPSFPPASFQRSQASAKTLHLVGGRRLWRDQSQGREQLRALGIWERGFLLLSPIF